MLYPLSYEGGVVSLPEKTFAPRVVRRQLLMFSYEC